MKIICEETAPNKPLQLMVVAYGLFIPLISFD